MVGEDRTLGTIKVVSPNLQRKNNCAKLEIVGCVVLLVDLELTRRVSDNLVPLHDNTTKTKVRGITIDNEVIVSVR
ncbi:hypothetical protein HanIR_Chr04g0160001 [Helianthus annuus]|nr:hypothetical protein HanIR_Chr04g0160001 [Helianthus annuus]